MAQSLLDALREVNKGYRQKSLEELIEDTFGPNPCDQLHLHNTETGETLNLTCDTKRCLHCGPRKKAILQHQMQQLLGRYVYIARTTDKTLIDRGIEAAKKRRQRNGEDFYYTIVGDATLGYLIISNTQLLDEQRLMDIRDWWKRILDTYHHAVQRIRRSRAFGRMSLVTLRRKGNKGHPSPWLRKTLNTEAIAEAETHDWDDLLAELTHKHDTSEAYPPPLDPPTQTVVSDLPIPF